MADKEVELCYANGSLYKRVVVPLEDGELPRVILDRNDVWLWHRTDRYRRCSSHQLDSKFFNLKEKYEFRNLRKRDVDTYDLNDLAECEEFFETYPTPWRVSGVDGSDFLCMVACASKGQEPINLWALQAALNHISKITNKLIKKNKYLK